MAGCGVWSKLYRLQAAPSDGRRTVRLLRLPPWPVCIQHKGRSEATALLQIMQTPMHAWQSSTCQTARLRLLLICKSCIPL